MKRYNLLLALFLILFFAGFSLKAQNHNISQGTIFDGEPYLAVNPKKPQHMVVAWMGYLPFTKSMIKTKTSFDGGRTWSNENHITHTNSAYGSADPSMAFDGDGNLFLSYVDFSSTLDSGTVYVRKSTDEGVSWGNPVEVIDAYSEAGKFPIDRPWIAVDRWQNANSGNIYVTTMNPGIFGYIAPPYHPYFTVSKDGGESFNPWKHLDTTNWLAGNIISQPMPTPCVSANGVFYAVYPSYKYSQNSLAQYIIASSSDGGETFTYHSVLTSSNFADDPLAKKGYLLRADPSDANHLVFFFLSTLYGDIDVLITESYDAGVSWSEPVRVNDDPVGNNRMQDLVWADFDDNGNLAMAWRDRRNGLDSTYATSFEIWGAVKKHNSDSILANFRISDTLIEYASVLAASGNDFMCVKFKSDTLNVVWGDPRNGKLNIWFQRMTMDGKPLSVSKITADNTPAVEVFPNPTTLLINVKGCGLEKIDLFNEQGKRVARFENLNWQKIQQVDLSSFPDGVYFVQVTAAAGVVTRKVIKK